MYKEFISLSTNTKMKIHSLSFTGRINILFFCCFCLFQQVAWAKKDINTQVWTPTTLGVNTNFVNNDIKWTTGTVMPNCLNGGTYNGGTGSQSPMISINMGTSTYPIPTSVPEYVNVACTNTTTLKINQQTNDPFHYRVKLRAFAYNVSGTSVTTYPITLEVSYNNTSGVQYKEKDSYQFNNGYYVVYCINQIEVENTATNVWTTLYNWPSMLSLESNIEVERYYNMDAFATVNPSIINPSTPAPKVLNDVLTQSNYEVQLSWAGVEAAEYYDVEWLYVDNYAPTSLPNAPVYVLPANLSFDFNQQANRVNLPASQTTFKITNSFQRGYLIFRVRPVGVSPTDPEQLIPGVWSFGAQGNVGMLLAAPWSDDYVEIQVPHQKNLNWQYSASYAEEGKKKEVISYFDGTLRDRQTVTKLNSDNFPIVGEKVYDFHGRPAVSILPVPSQTVAPLQFFAGFNLNAATKAYNWTNFDISSSNTSYNPADLNTATLKNTVGAANYYGLLNGFYGNAQAFVPNSNGYPFVRTEYTPDNTGRVSRQSGVGTAHKLGSGHETQYLYSMPLQAELNSLFGTEVGYAEHYRKEAVIDANGQTSVSYKDLSGHVIATTLEGDAPSNLMPLPNPVISTITENLASPNYNHINADNTGKEVSFTFMVTSANTYTFKYGFSASDLEVPCQSSTMDIPIYYDLSFSLIKTDGSGTNLIDPAQQNLTVETNALTSVPDIGIPLLPGTYMLYKSIKVNQSKLEEAIAQYTNQCLASQQEQWVLTYIENNPPDYTLCDEVSGDLTPEENQAMICNNMRKLMLEDLSPGGQWATYEIDLSGNAVSTDPYSLLNPNNQLSNLVDANNSAPFSYQNVIFPNGQSFSNLNDLIAAWDWTSTAWAEAMLMRDPNNLATSASNHPEYCIYDFQCEAPSATQKYDVYAFENLLNTTESFEEALNLNLIDQRGNLMVLQTACTSPTPALLDPLFDPNIGLGTLGTQTIQTLLSAFKVKLFEKYQELSGANIGTYYNIYQLALSSAFCDGASPCAFTYALHNDPQTMCNSFVSSDYIIPNLGSDDGCHRDQYWQVLRTLYVAARKQFTEKMISDNLRTYPLDPAIAIQHCLVCYLPEYDPSGNCLSHQWPDPATNPKTRLFPKPNDLLASAFSGMPDMYNDPMNALLAGPMPPTAITNALNDQCSTVCEGYANYWITQLNALFVDKNLPAIPSPSPTMDAIIANMKSLCICGCDVTHPMGSSELNAPCTATTYTSFFSIINNYLPSYGITKQELDAYITSPSSYNEEDIAANSPILDPCTCNKILSVYANNTQNYEEAFFNLTGVHLPNISSLKCACESALNISDITANWVWDASSTAALASMNVPVIQTFPCYPNTTPLCMARDEFQLVFETASANAGKPMTPLPNPFPPLPPLPVYTQLEKNLIAAYINNHYNSLGFDVHYDFAFYRDFYYTEIGGETLICFDLVIGGNPCYDYLYSQATASAINLFQQYVQEEQAALYDTYMAHAMAMLDIHETYSMSFDNKGQQYTLYYYDRAGNLVKTVPPNGIVLPQGTPLDIATFHDYVNTERDNGPITGVHIYPAHTQATQYRYNSLNQMYASRTPDVGDLSNTNTALTRYWYDNQGRIIASQNPRQTGTSVGTSFSYSYTKYDNLGRTVEAGQVVPSTNSYVIPSAAGNLLSAVQFINFKSMLNTSSKNEITKTYYNDYVYNQLPSNAHFGTYQVIAPNYATLRNRIASTTYEDITDDSYNNAVHYEYDIHGNVKRMVYDNPELAAFGVDERYKTTQYKYDLLTGKVNEVKYQAGKKDQLTHRYNYDADNRIVSVFTSRNGIHFDRDAAYSYYRHGPLARTELGENRVQGLDYAYTLQGWIKGVNSAFISQERDMGKDGSISTNATSWSYYNNLVGTTFQSTNRSVARDAFAYQLNYFEGLTTTTGDYSPITPVSAGYTVARKMEVDNTYTNPNTSLRPVSLFNGNIAAMSTSLRNTAATSPTSANAILPAQLKRFRYDQLNRITQMDIVEPISAPLNSWNTSATNAYKEAYSYDANGNITDLYRNNDNSANNYLMDNMIYNYSSSYPNRLTSISDYASNTLSTVDIDNQNPNNYQYDLLGNLIADQAGNIANVTWDNRGKIRSVTFVATPPLIISKTLHFRYDAMGNRIAKRFTQNGVSTYTYYVHDAEGNTMATYNRKSENFPWTDPLGVVHTLTATENKIETLALGSLYLYGSSRLGEIASSNLPWAETHATTILYNGNSSTIVASTTITSPLSLTQRGNIRNAKYYELSNHLGNVLATITDAKIAVFTGVSPNLVLSYYLPTMHSNSDYYPFGMEMPGRNSAAGGYRYGFNGKENDSEMYGDGGFQDYGMRMYDPRVCRFPSVDPLTSEYAYYTPYQFAGNKPIQYIDLDGLEESAPPKYSPMVKLKLQTKITVITPSWIFPIRKNITLQVEIPLTQEPTGEWVTGEHTYAPDQPIKNEETELYTKQIVETYTTVDEDGEIYSRLNMITIIGTTPEQVQTSWVVAGNVGGGSKIGNADINAGVQVQGGQAYIRDLQSKAGYSEETFTLDPGSHWGYKSGSNVDNHIIVTKTANNEDFEPIEDNGRRIKVKTSLSNTYQIDINNSKTGTGATVRECYDE